jgi:hypothetical protein
MGFFVLPCLGDWSGQTKCSVGNHAYSLITMSCTCFVFLKWTFYKFLGYSVTSWSRLGHEDEDCRILSLASSEGLIYRDSFSVLAIWIPRSRTIGIKCFPRLKTWKIYFKFEQKMPGCNTYRMGKYLLHEAFIYEVSVLGCKMYLILCGWKTPVWLPLNCLSFSLVADWHLETSFVRFQEMTFVT